MRCEQAQQLFDAYLDDDLSPSLAMELDAHRLQCADCRRALALLEVSGHVLTRKEALQPSHDFVDRLLACMDPVPESWLRNRRKMLWIGGPLAAAAVVALAFVGFSRERESIVAGKKSVLIERPASSEEVTTQSVDPAEWAPGDKESIEALVDRVGRNVAAKRQSAESLQKGLDLTAQQILDMLRQSKELPEGDSGDAQPEQPSEDSTQDGDGESSLDQDGSAPATSGDESPQ